MEIRIETASYNHRRYSKPWIAKVDFSKSPKGDFVWGNFLGGDPGDEGMLTIQANPGDIVANGQRDNRGSNTDVSYNYVTLNGELAYLGNKAEAYKHFTETKTSAPDLDALRKERETLVARIAEIDAILNN